MRGKRFIFATIMGICVTVAAIILKFDGEIYWKLVGTITAVFTIGQTYSDVKYNGGTK